MGEGESWGLRRQKESRSHPPPHPGGSLYPSLPTSIHEVPIRGSLRIGFLQCVSKEGQDGLLYHPSKTLPHRYHEIPTKKKLEQGGVYSGSQFRGSRPS